MKGRLRGIQVQSFPGPRRGKPNRGQKPLGGRDGTGGASRFHSTGPHPPIFAGAWPEFVPLRASASADVSWHPALEQEAESR
jgi:hypothetical protein